MCVNDAWAVVEALLSRKSPFVRTAKYRIEGFKDSWKGKIYRSVGTRSILIEGLFAAYMCVTFLFLFKLRNWGAMPYLLLFATGYVYILGLSLLHARR
jgi:hypothetical protein